MVLFPIFPSPIADKKIETVELSSLEAPQISCLSFYFENKRHFNPFLFQVHKIGLLKQETITAEEIQASIKSPEYFLAVIEVLSSKDKYQGLGLEERILALNPKELKKLRSLIASSTKNGTVSKIAFTELLVKIYRLCHKPKGLWRNLYETRDIAEAFDKLDDSTIRERIEMSLWNETMEQTFATVVSDPTLGKRFVKFIRDNADNIDVALFLALWGSTLASKIYLGFDIELSAKGIIEILPPYIPGTGQFLKIALTENDLQTARLRGLKTAIDEAKAKMTATLKKIHTVDFVRWTSSAIFTSYFLLTIGPAIQDYQKQKADQASAAFNSVFKEAGDQARQSNSMTAEERGDESFQKLLAILDANGTKYNINSPEMQAKRTEQIEMARGIMEAQKRKNPN